MAATFFKTRADHRQRVQRHAGLIAKTAEGLAVSVRYAANFNERDAVEALLPLINNVHNRLRRNKDSWGRLLDHVLPADELARLKKRPEGAPPEIAGSSRSQIESRLLEMIESVQRMADEASEFSCRASDVEALACDLQVLAEQLEAVSRRFEAEAIPQE